jgi:predicted nucleic acid-binding protein
VTGNAKTCIHVARLIDTNILVYRVDPRDAVKQRIARDVLSAGLIDDSLLVPHQAIVEFVAAVSRPRPDLDGQPLLPRAEALLEAESLTVQFRIVYSNADVLNTALRGCAIYGLPWFDAHLWAYAECFGMTEIISEDFEHGRHFGRVRIFDPFLAASNQVPELPAMYESPSNSARQAVKQKDSS